MSAPGPYTLGNRDGYNAHIVHDANGEGLASVYGLPMMTGRDELEALAQANPERWGAALATGRVLAASATMLEALKLALPALSALALEEKRRNVRVGSMVPLSTATERYEAALAAIAAAEGTYDRRA